jgi:GNAT superfamily N-acetyltransferase
VTRRRVRPLTSADVPALPSACRTCLVWELGTTRTGGRSLPALAGAPREDPPTQPEARKQSWIDASVEAGVAPGRVVVADDQVVAYALFAPVASFARRRPPAPAASADALLLATAWVHPLHRELGVGQQLVQAAVREAVHRDLVGVEAYGDRRFQERACVLPATWLLRIGFEVRSEHPRTPLFRLDVRRTVRWAESVEHAMEGVLGHLPRRNPVPVPERFDG